MKKKPQWLRNLGEKFKSVTENTKESIDTLSSSVSKQAKKLDDEHNLTDSLESIGESTKNYISEVDEKYSISDKAVDVKESISNAGSKVSKASKDLGVLDALDSAKDNYKEYISEPVSRYVVESGINRHLDTLLKKTEVAYGETRSLLKPYFAPETPRELLKNTREELLYINACILQISIDESEKLANQLGSVVLSKVSGAASVGTLFALVSTFGTAGTGTAIAGLSGAAATNATLAWVGGLLGGGMVTGAVLTGGLALAVGVGVYKLVGSEARKFEDLSETEQRIVESTGFLIAAINDILQQPAIHLDSQEARLLLNNTLMPLYQTLVDEGENITLRFRQHAIVDFKKRVIDGFEYFIKEAKKSTRLYPEYVIAGVIYALLTRTAVDDSVESQIALDAIRRMKNDWHDASETQLSEAISEYEPEQLKGIANNVKGIYHELLFVDNYNKQNADTYAILFEETNHPGADVQIRSVSDDLVLREFQLKSTNSEAYVNEHVERYPDIDLLVSEEVAINSANFETSGISNDEITAHIDQILEEIGRNTLSEKAFDAMGFAGLAAGKQTIDMISGKQDASGAGAEVVKAAMVASSSTMIASYLFS